MGSKVFAEVNGEGVYADFGKVLDLALEVGAGILSSGGSVSRVETAVDGICRAYGAVEVNVAAYSSMIISSVRTSDGRDFSFMKRVVSSSNNLGLLEKFNQLSRDICGKKFSVDIALERCKQYFTVNVRNRWLTILGGGILAGTYAVFFGGTLADILPAFIVAFIMCCVSELLNMRKLNVYAGTFILSLIGGMLSISLCKLFVIMGLKCHGSEVIIGTIMTLIPGLMTTNAVRDLFTGDIMRGTFSLLNGVLLTVVIAAGYGASSIILYKITDFISPPVREGLEYYLYLLISGTLGTVGISFYFNLNYRRVGWAIGATALTIAVYIGMEILVPGNIFVPYFVATLFAGIVSELLARYVRMPATVVLVPAIIAFVPGGSLYYTMQYIVSGDMANAEAKGKACVIILLALAVGICVSTILFHLISPVMIKGGNKKKIRSAFNKADKDNNKEVKK